MADTLERRKARQDQLTAQSQSKRGAAGTFLQNYLDPKDYLSGTAYDPMILEGLQDAMQQGAKLAAAGADSPTLMMALGPMVNRLTTYSTNAKNINKQVDDSIKGMQADKQEGYNWQALKQEALQKAFFKTDEKGQHVLDPDNANPSIDWIGKAIEDSPEKVTTPEAFDFYAKNSQVNKSLHDITEMDSHGNPSRSKVHLTAQNYLSPEYDKKTGKVNDFVPIHDLATEKGDPLYHTFTDAKGNETKAQVRLLDEKLFDSLRPGQINYVRGLVKQHINEYQNSTGEKISMDSPKAKLIARALAYDELNKPTRKSTNIEYVQQEKLSPQQINLNVGGTDQYLQNLQAQTAARTAGRLSVSDQYKINAVQAIGKIVHNDSEFLQGPTVDRDGRKLVDVSSVFPGGGLSPGKGANFKYKGVFYDPDKREFVVDKSNKDQFGLEQTWTETVPQKDLGKFIYKIASSNGVPYSKVKKLLDEIGFRDGKIQGVPDEETIKDFEKRKKEKSYGDILAHPFGKPFGAK